MIVSIPHTGTSFLSAFFQRLGHSLEGAHVGVDDPASYRGRRMVVPLRDPAENMLSHWQRYGLRDFGGLARCWGEVVELEAWFVPVDADVDRYAMLRGALDHLGLSGDDAIVCDYATRWEPLNSAGLSLEQEAYRTDGRLPGAISEALAAIPVTFFRRWYPPFRWEACISP